MKYTLGNLDVYNLAESFADEIWIEIEKWKYFEVDTVGKQLVRAADSISVNIAEGYGRYSYKEDTHFLHIARGSATECKSWLRKCKRRKLIDAKKAGTLLTQLETIALKLNAYIKFVDSGILKRKIT